MNASAEPVTCQFYRLTPGAPDPQRADRSADGMLPMRAYSYCEAVRTASAFGWYIYPPLSFSLIFDGIELAWTYAGASGWYPLGGAQVPGFRKVFEATAPDEAKLLAPQFLAAAREPGVVQIWSGYLARTAPSWGLLSRAPANIPKTKDYEQFEGIIETDTWFGPLITNLRLIRTNSPVEFHMRYPLFQVQPILRQCYDRPSFAIADMADLTPADWERFVATTEPNTDQMRPLGHYAVETRKRLRGAPT